MVITAAGTGSQRSGVDSPQILAQATDAQPGGVSWVSQILVYHFGVPILFRPLRDDVRDLIRERIIDGSHAPGSRLVERTIAAELGVSRIPVREALQALVIEGFAVDRQTRGIAVRSYQPAQLVELADVGAALERVMIGSIASTADRTGLASLQTVLDDAQSAIDRDDRGAAVAANVRFHDVLGELGAGTIAHEVLMIVAQRRRWLLSQHIDAASIHAEHVELYEAIAAGDRPRAEQIAENHAQSTIAHALRKGTPQQ